MSLSRLSEWLDLAAAQADTVRSNLDAPGVGMGCNLKCWQASHRQGGACRWAVHPLCLGHCVCRESLCSQRKPQTVLLGRRWAA